VFELLELDDAMVSALRMDNTEGFSQAAKKSPYFQPLALAALDYAKQGITSLEEVFKLVDRFEKIEKPEPLATVASHEKDESGLSLEPREPSSTDGLI
jgi:MSHA biogenesis protein MshE